MLKLSSSLLETTFTKLIRAIDPYYLGQREKMAVIGRSQGPHKQWRRTANVVLMAFVSYGIGLGAVAEMDAWTSAIGTETLAPLNYPGLVAFFFIQSVLSPYDLQPTMFLPTAAAWILIGFILHVIIRFKAAMIT